MNGEPLTPLAARSARLGRLPPSPTSSAGGFGGETVRTGGTALQASRYDDGMLDRTFWSRNERRAIASAGGLPREVVGLIKESGMFGWPQCPYYVV